MLTHDTFEDYIGNPAIGHSMFHTFVTEGPREYEGQYITKTVERKDSAKMDIGTLAHAAILEPDEMDSRYVVIPRDALTSNGAKRGKAWDQFKAENDGKLMLKAPELKHVKAMRDAVWANPLIEEKLDVQREVEVSCYFDYLRVPCKARFDFLGERYGIDVKTTEPSLRKFDKVSADMDYHGKAAWYINAAMKAGRDDFYFYILAVRQKPPYQVRLYEHEPELLLAADNSFERFLPALEERLGNGDWSDPGEDEINVLRAPYYMRKQLQEPDGPTYETDDDFTAELEAVASKITRGEFKT